MKITKHLPYLYAYLQDRLLLLRLDGINGIIHISYTPEFRNEVNTSIECTKDFIEFMYKLCMDEVPTSRVLSVLLSPSKQSRPSADIHFTKQYNGLLDCSLYLLYPDKLKTIKSVPFGTSTEFLNLITQLKGE